MPKRFSSSPQNEDGNCTSNREIEEDRFELISLSTIENNNTNSNIINNNNNNTFLIRLLVTRENKEYSIELPPSVLEETVFQLKQRIVNVINAPVEEQRLIYSGQMLKDGTLLKEYKLKPNNVIHVMFSNRIEISASNNNIQHNKEKKNNDNNSEIARNEINLEHLDITLLNSEVLENVILEASAEAATRSRIIRRHSRQIQLLSIFLVTICSLQLAIFCMDILFLIANGDSVIQENIENDPYFRIYFALYILQVVIYIIGVYTGYTGLRSVISLDLKLVRRYYHSLVFVGVSCLVLRIIWAFFLTQYNYDIGGYSYRSMTGEEITEEDTTEREIQDLVDDKITDTSTIEGGESSNLSQMQVSSIVILTVVVYFSIWGLCIVKARAFKNSVENLQERLRTPRAIADFGDSI